MSAKKKRSLYAIYYIGLICGTLLLNYTLLKHEEIAREWMNTFSNLDNLMYINKQELFLYVLYKRAKQAAICAIVYIYFSKLAIILFLVFYGAFILGVTASLFAYYNGIAGILQSLILFTPYLFLYITLSNSLSKKIAKSSYKKENNTIYYVFLFIILIIISILIEITVNIAINTCFFNNK